MKVTYSFAIIALALMFVADSRAMGHKRQVPTVNDGEPITSVMPSARPSPESPQPLPSIAPSPTSITTPVNAAPVRRIRVGNIVGTLPGEIEMIHSGENLANAMLDNPCFKQWVGAARYTENNGMTSAQILNQIETQVSSINVEMYYEKTNVVGYENDPFDGYVHMNRRWVTSASLVADNLLHEDRGHSLGFHHYGKFSTSVPYGMNYAYEGCDQQQMRVRGAKNFRPKGLRIKVYDRKHPRRPKFPKKDKKAR